MTYEAFSYLDSLDKNQATIQPAIEQLMAECVAYPAGRGFTDLITRREHCKRFLDGLTEIGVVVRWICLYCDHTPENEARYGCPHGAHGYQHDGGFFLDPLHVYDRYSVDDMWVSANAVAGRDFRLVDVCNALAAAYVEDCIRSQAGMLPCMAFAFSLAVPEGWTRATYRPLTAS